jgi:hypothetical protein
MKESSQAATDGKSDITVLPREEIIRREVNCRKPNLLYSKCTIRELENFELRHKQRSSSVAENVSSDVYKPCRMVVSSVCYGNGSTMLLVNTRGGDITWRKKREGLSRDNQWMGLPHFMADFSFIVVLLHTGFTPITNILHNGLSCSDSRLLMTDTFLLTIQEGVDVSLWV